MKKIYTITTLLFGIISLAQDGTLDNTFGTSGLINIPIIPFLTDMKIDSDGKIILAGGQNDNILIYRLNPDGSFDTTFDIDGKKEIDLGTSFSIATSIALDDDDNIIIATDFYGKLVKLLNSDGSLDPNFGTSGILTYQTDYDKYIKVAVDNNNKIIVCNYQFDTSVNFSYYNKIHRFNTNGVIDPSFNSGNPIEFNYGFNQPASVNGLVIDNDNKIFVSITEVNGNVPLSNAIIKYNENGTLDTSFTNTSNGIATTGSLFRGIHLNGNNVYACVANPAAGSWWTATVIKYNTNGTKDITYDTDGIVNVVFGTDYYNLAYGISNQPDGKIIITANSRLQTSTSLTNMSVARINLNGTLDTSFGTNGKTLIPMNTSNYGSRNLSAINPTDGKLYAVTVNSATTLGLYRFITGVVLSNDTFQSKKITLSPNPTNSNITFSEDISNLEIFDITGKKVKTFENTFTTFNVSTLEKGIYFLKGKTVEGNSFNEKLIKKE